MVGRVEGEQSLSNEPTSETVFMRVIQNAGSNSFNPNVFLEDAGILCQRKDATATYNPTSGTLEMTDVLTYLRAVAEQHIPEIYDAANNPETGIYAEGKQLTPEEKRAAARTLLLLTESREDLQVSLKESEIRQVEMGINDLFEINGPLWDQENADSLLSTEARRSIGQAVARLPEEQINAQMAAYIKEKPAFFLKDILVRSMNQDAAGNTGRTITPEQLKAYLIANPVDVFKFNNDLVSQTDKDIRKTVVWGAENVDRKTIQSLVKENPLFALQTGGGMLEIIPRDTSKIIIEAMKALTPEQVKAPLTANPLDILKVVPANLSYLKPETLAALKEEAGKLRFKLRGAEQTEETPTGPAAQAQPAAGTPQTAASPEASTTIPPELADLIKYWQELGVPPERIEAYLAQRSKTDATLAENIAQFQDKPAKDINANSALASQTLDAPADKGSLAESQIKEVPTGQSEPVDQGSLVSGETLVADLTSFGGGKEPVTVKDWQSQLRQMTDKEHLIEGKAVSQSYIDFVQSLLNQGISSDELAIEVERYLEERKATTTSNAAEDADRTPALAPATSTRQVIRLGREAIGTPPEKLIERINGDLAKATSSKVSVAEDPENIIDYLKSIDLKWGVKIKEASTQIRGDQLSIEGSASVPLMGDAKFSATLAPGHNGELNVISHKVDTSWRLKTVKGKIEDNIAQLHQKMEQQISQKVDRRWKYVGFRIAGDQLTLDFDKKQ